MYVCLCVSSAVCVLFTRRHTVCLFVCLGLLLLCHLLTHAHTHASNWYFFFFLNRILFSILSLSHMHSHLHFLYGLHNLFNFFSRVELSPFFFVSHSFHAALRIVFFFSTFRIQISFFFLSYFPFFPSSFGHCWLCYTSYCHIHLYLVYPLAQCMSEWEWNVEREGVEKGLR